MCCNEENLFVSPGLFSLTGATLRLLGLSASRIRSGVVRRHTHNYAGKPAVSADM
jgi:hypothetical protein